MARARDKHRDRREALHRLAGEIRAALQRGLSQDQATLDTVLAALGQTDAHAALALLAADPEAAEHAPLVALLLSPGPALLRELEPALARADLDAREALLLADLVADLAAEGVGEGVAEGGAQGLLPVLLPMLLPDGTRVGLRAPAEALRACVRRLRPEATAPAELRALLARRCGPGQAKEPDRTLAADLAMDLAVLLRHSRLAWTPERVFFIATLLERARPDSGDLPGLIAWATGCLEDSGPEPELRRALAGRRQALLAQLRQAEFLEQALARGSYETLMAQGLRLAHVHGPEVRAELAHLERAGMLALGLPGEALDGANARSLGQAEDIQALLRRMPGLED